MLHHGNKMRAKDNRKLEIILKLLNNNKQ